MMKHMNQIFQIIGNSRMRDRFVFKTSYETRFLFVFLKHIKMYTLSITLFVA